MENSDLIKYGAMILVCTALIGSITYNVYDIGEELTCRANKPTGWELLDMHKVGNMTIYEAYCPYTTKEWVYANCSGFRETSSYLRYGCVEVVFVENTDIIEKNVSIIIDNLIAEKPEKGKGNVEICRPEGCEMVNN